MKHETFDDLLKEDKKEKSGDDDDSDNDLDIGRFRIDAKEVRSDPTSVVRSQSHLSEKSLRNSARYSAKPHQVFPTVLTYKRLSDASTNTIGL